MLFIQNKDHFDTIAFIVDNGYFSAKEELRKE
jgi:hypothetical protein